MVNPYPKTCILQQFTGELEFDAGIEDKREIYFAYNFAPPKTETVHEEYLIYDAIGLIGSVGGTLGMCYRFCICLPLIICYWWVENIFFLPAF